MSSKTAQAYRRIRRLIEGGHLIGGERLTEARAAELVDVGRGPVRESLVRLEAEGLLKNQGIRRSRVIAYTEDQEPGELLYRYELREQIESGAARLAAKNMTGWQIDQLRELAEAAEDAWQSPEREVYAEAEAAVRLHHFLLANCGNPLLLEVWRFHRLSPPLPRSQKLEERILADAVKADPQDTRYMAVVDAIAAHDPDEAERLMKRQVRLVTEAVRAIVMEHAKDGKPGKLPLFED